MNKVIIAIGVILSAYLIYSSLNSGEENTPVTAEKLMDEQQDAVSNTSNVIESFDEEPEVVYDNKSSTIEGRYILNITTDTTETSQVFEFSSNGTFDLNRKMISPNPALGGTIEGTYTIKGNIINLIFSPDRNKDLFPVDTGTMTIKSDTELAYGSYIAVLD
jgi:hypothetical protein